LVNFTMDIMHEEEAAKSKTAAGASSATPRFHLLSTLFYAKLMTTNQAGVQHGYNYSNVAR
jgi:hypothetical protein